VNRAAVELQFSARTRHPVSKRRKQDSPPTY
jgi:hypothetical protein